MLFPAFLIRVHLLRNCFEAFPAALPIVVAVPIERPRDAARAPPFDPTAIKAYSYPVKRSM